MLLLQGCLKEHRFKCHGTLYPATERCEDAKSTCFRDTPWDAEIPVGIAVIDRRDSAPGCLLGGGLCTRQGADRKREQSGCGYDFVVQLGTLMLLYV